MKVILETLCRARREYEVDDLNCYEILVPILTSNPSGVSSFNQNLNYPSYSTISTRKFRYDGYHDRGFPVYLEIFEGYKTQQVKYTQICSHEFIIYHGFNEYYEYCKKCNERKS